MADGGVGVETVENISAAPLDSWDSIESIEPGTEPEARREPNAVETVKAEEASAESPPVATPEPTLDRMGRLHRPDGTIMPKEEADAYKAANPAKPIPATPEPVAAAAAPEKANDLPTPVPWTFRAKGQDVTPEGAQHIPGHGVFIPEQFVPNFRQAFAHHIERDGLIQRNTQIQQEFEQANQKGSVAEAKLNVVLNGLSVPELVRGGMNAQAAEMLISRLALDIGRAEVSIALNNRQSAPATVAPSHDNDVMEQVDSVIEAARQNPALADIFSHPQAGPAFLDTLREELVSPKYRVKWADIPPAERERLDPRLQNVEFYNRQSANGRIGNLAQRFRAMIPARINAPTSAQVAASNAAKLNGGAPSGPPAAASAPSATSNAATPRSGRRAASHFTGKTDKEKAKAARDWFNDPDAT